MQTVVVLDRIEPGDPEPEYHVYGRATCVGGCGEWLWLGDRTFEIVDSRQALPVCRPCAIRLIPPENGQPVANVQNTLREGDAM